MLLVLFLTILSTVACCTGEWCASTALSAPTTLLQAASRVHTPPPLIVDVATLGAGEPKDPGASQDPGEQPESESSESQGELPEERVSEPGCVAVAEFLVLHPQLRRGDGCFNLPAGLWRLVPEH